MARKQTGVYCIVNKVNGKRYVGSAAHSLEARGYSHFWHLERDTHKNKHLQASFNKYGKDNFEFAVLERCSPNRCVKREQRWMNHFQSWDRRFGYNQASRAGSTLGRRYSEETKQVWVGKRHTLESRMKMTITNRGKGKALKGRPKSPEHRAKLSAAIKAKGGIGCFRKGFVKTAEHRARIAATLKGRKQPPELVAKRVAKLRGRKRTAEQRLRLSLSRTHESRSISATKDWKSRKAKLAALETE